MPQMREPGKDEQEAAGLGYMNEASTSTKLRRSSEKLRRHCSYEAMKGKVRRRKFNAFVATDWNPSLAHKGPTRVNGRPPPSAECARTRATCRQQEDTPVQRMHACVRAVT